jgi:hypothetical protein
MGNSAHSMAFTEYNIFLLIDKSLLIILFSCLLLLKVGDCPEMKREFKQTV